MDLIGDVPAVESVLRRARPVPLIVTVRSAAEGGAWTDGERRRLATLLRLARWRPDYIDVEWDAWRRSASLRRAVGEMCLPPPARAPAVPQGVAATTLKPDRPRLILSHHSRGAVPRRMRELLAALSAGEAHVVKAAFCARDATDALRALAEVCDLTRRDRLILVATGEGGLCTRILAPKLGLFATFASLRAGAESAHGQPPVADVRERYRWEMIDARTRVLGVVGWPVSHSASPAVHNAALAAADINAVYVPLPVKPGYRSLAGFLDLISDSRELAVTGLSVTHPHKENALRWLEFHGHVVDQTALRCRAVNTLVRRPDSTWLGCNTDLPAFQEALRRELSARSPAWAGRRVAVLGAGGVARAVVMALLELGCSVVVYARTARRAQRLARELGCDWQPWAARLRYEGDVLVNCTPVGMWPDVRGSPLPDVALRRGTVVVDTIYQPAETRLLRAARRRGCAVMGGQEMFIRQAAGQFEVWHGQAAPLDIMRQAMRRGH